MSIQGHVDAIKRHKQNAENSNDTYEREKELKFARIAYERLCSECSSKSEKQVMRDSPEGYDFWNNGVEGL